MYLNEQHNMAGLGVQSMFLPMPYVGASTERIKTLNAVYILKLDLKSGLLIRCILLFL